MDAIAHGRTAAPQPPGFLATAWTVLLGFLAAAVSVGFVAFAAFAVGIAGHDSTGHERPSALDWPFTHAGPWSLASNLIVTTAILLLCAFCIADLVSRRYGEQVSLWRTFGIVVVTGYAPWVAYRGLLPLHFFLGLLGTTFIVRRYAIGVRAPHRSPRTRAAVAAATIALLCL